MTYISNLPFDYHGSVAPTEQLQQRQQPVVSHNSTCHPTEAGFPSRSWYSICRPRMNERLSRPFVIFHTPRKPADSITRHTLTLNPERKRWRLKNTLWRRDLEADVKEMKYYWAQLKRLTRNRSECLAELCWQPLPQVGRPRLRLID